MMKMELWCVLKMRMPMINKWCQDDRDDDDDNDGGDNGGDIDVDGENCS